MRGSIVKRVSKKQKDDNGVGRLYQDLEKTGEPYGHHGHRHSEIRRFAELVRPAA